MAIQFDSESLKNLVDITSPGEIGKHAFRVLLYIVAVMDHDNKAKVDQQKLAARLGVSGQTLYMATKALCEFGFIVKSPTNTRSKTFIVNPALALADQNCDYEAIMEEFSAAQNAASALTAEPEGEVEVPVFQGIPEE